MKTLPLVAAVLLLTSVRCPAHPIHMMTFNIRYDNPGDGANRWSARKEAVVDFLRTQAPDIVGLQEALPGQLADLQAALPGYQRVGVGREDGKAKGEHCAILVLTSRFTVVRSGTFWLSDTPEVPGSRSWGNNIPRICTWVHLRDSSGKEAHVFNAHFDHQSQPSREKSAALLRDRMAAVSGPCVLLGDFNATPDNPAVKLLLQAGWRDGFAEAAPKDDPGGTFHNWRGGGGGPRIDHVFVRPPARAIRCTVHRAEVRGRVVSDHHPVSLEMEWE